MTHDTDPISKYILPPEDEYSLWWSGLNMSDIVELDEWKIEYARLHKRIMNHTQLPNVLSDLVTTYAGSAYADVLIPLGSDMVFMSCIYSRIGGPSDWVPKAAETMIKILTRETGMRPTSDPHTIDQINQLIKKYTMRFTYSNGLRQYATIYRILLTHFV